MPYRVNVWKHGHWLQEGLWELDRFEEGTVLWDAQHERFIGSVGRNVWNGRILAAVDVRFADDPNYDCLYLRD